MLFGSIERQQITLAHKCVFNPVLGFTPALRVIGGKRNSFSSHGFRLIASAAASDLDRLPVIEEKLWRPATLSPPGLSNLGEQEMKQPKLMPVSFGNGIFAVDGGFTFLKGVGKHITASKTEIMEHALVVGVSADEVSNRADTILGELVCSRFFACARIKLWWMTPEWGSKASELPPETQFLLLQLGRGGPFAVLLPLIDSMRFRCTLRPPRTGIDKESELRLRIESGDEAVRSSQWNSSLLVAAGYDAYHLVDLAVAASAHLSGGAKARVDKVVPEFVNHFGWCTWDAFYSTVSAEGLQQGLQSFKEGNVPPRFLIIDDGWQQTGPDKYESTSSTVRLEAKKEMLKAVGAGGHYPTNKLQADDNSAKAESQTSWLFSLFDRGIGRVQALAETALLLFYKGIIESAPEGSWRISFFTALTQGPLKSALLSYYALTSDHTQRLLGVQANGKFSSTSATAETPMAQQEDLKSIVADARDRFGVKFVFAWHSLHGYWAGIATGNSAAMPYNGRLIMPNPTPGVLEIDPCFAWQQQVMAGVGVAQDISALYRDMHTYLAGAGIDGVKVDCQAILGMVGGGSPGLGGGPALAAEYHTALEASVAKHFPGNNCINCMCHSTEDLYRMESTTVARSSDDFWPQDPASHTTHVAVNAYNSLFMGALLLPDWDMFHSQHPAALLHATARVVSGGPLYVSDKPGQHDISLLKRLVLSDGTLLRCTQPGRPTVDCLFDDVMRDRNSLLKVWNTNICNGVVASFNLQGASWSRKLRKYHIHDSKPDTLSTVVSPADIPAMMEMPRSSRFVIYSDRQKRMWECASWEGVSTLLKPGQSDLFTIAPLQSIGGAAIAPIGLTNMLNSGGAITQIEVSGDGKGGNMQLQATFKVRGRGELLAFCSSKPHICVVNGSPVVFLYNAKDCSLSVSLPAEASKVVITI